ncbi:hypothetical protein [Microbispora triticiradicis]|uniref:Uncharacterized protein n=2 Tax=Microbispora TaxID=2005 RepID=A0ABY3LT06_9ACTN|nr:MULTISPECIES: hypothetical protein [Microbispora]TLP52557.1 hypothetical protein FED44_31775 [Microbispora fusca]TYB52831.1 hypothetical protein FXF59_24205 [Microbispora tritici]
MTSPSGDFCGIDPAAMNAMAADLRRAADRLTAFSADFEGLFRANGVSTTPLTQVTAIADWGRGQVPKLSERAELIKALNGTGDHTFARLPDALDSFATGHGLGLMYGIGLLANPDFTVETKGDLVHQHIKEITALAKDPAAAAAFFATLPAEVRDALPDLLMNTGSPTAKEDLAAFSAALGAALRAPGRIPAFEKVKAELLSKPANRVVAWNRLTLLAGAEAPTDVRVAAARSLALDDFTKNPRQDWRGAGVSETDAYGYSPDTVALALGLLAGDGKAARAAFAQMGGDGVKLTQVEKMKQILTYAKSTGNGDDVADAFGRAMEAGSEAATEKPGKHSAEAAAFTLDAMLAAGSFGKDLPNPTRDSMTSIAKSYIHELASGARFDKAAYRASGMTQPDKWLHIAGVTPAFYLSPWDTYRFLQTFTGEERLTDDFDDTAAAYRYDTLTNAARLEANGTGGHLERASQMFGDLGGLEFKAALEVRGEKDATDGLIRDVVKNTMALGIDEIPVPFGKTAWTLAKTYAVSRWLDSWAASFETRVQALNEARANFTLRQKYDMAYLLHAAGFPASKPPAELVTAKTGHLKTFDEVMAEARTEATRAGKNWEDVLRAKLTPYERWMDSNEALDKQVERSSRAQTSELAKELITTWK